MNKHGMRPTSSNQRAVTIHRAPQNSKHKYGARLAAADTRQVTHDGDYRFESVFPGKYGATALIDSAGDPKSFKQPFMKEMLELEAAKQNAADESRKVALEEEGSDQRKIQAGVHVEAERLVVRRRVALINRLITEHHTPLCFKSHRSQPHSLLDTAVRYRLLQSDGTHGLFQTQAQQAWLLDSTPWGWNDILTALQRGTQDSQGLTSLVKDIMQNAGKDPANIEARLALHQALKTPLQFSTEHTLESTHWGPPEINQTPPKVVFTATTQDNIQVNICAASLDVNHCDEWHNPCINKYVQVHVARFGDSLLRGIMNQTIPAHELVNNPTTTLRVTVIVIKENKHHVFNLTPFASLDSCIATHIEVSNQRGGILELPDDPAQIEEHEGNITQTNASTEVYCCVGSHRSTRLNEQELNYVHAQALRAAHGMPHDNLPLPHELHHEGSRMAAKSARIAFTDWDVLVSSYRHTDGQGASTVITLVNYPPYATRHYYHTEAPGHYNKASHNPRTQGADGRPRKTTSWTRMLEPGEMYFIPGLRGTYDIEMGRRQYNIHLIDHSQSRRQTLEFQAEGLRISRKIHEIYDSVWQTNRQGGNYAKNIEHNHNAPYGVTKTMGQEYWELWVEFIRGWILNALNPQTLAFEPPDDCYLYCKNTTIWAQILRGWNEPMIISWTAYSQHRYHLDKDKLTLKEAPHMLNDDPASLGDKITLPARARRTEVAQAPAASAVMGQAMQQLRDQIRVLEHKLNEKQRDENKGHFMKMILDKLNTTATHP